jgi:peptidyl-prolyl cis-trans isomerase SurA
MSRMRSRLGSCLVWLVALAGTVGLGTVASVIAQEVSIKVLVNDDPISDYDIQQRERFLALTTQQQPSPELNKKSVDLLIDERLQLQQGRKLGVTADESDVLKILGDMAGKNNLTVEGLETALGKAGVNIKTLKERIRAQIVWQDVVRRKFRNDVQIGEAEVDEALSEAGVRETEGEQGSAGLQLRQVKFTLPDGADQTAVASRLATAEAMRQRFTSCANIADLAKGIEGASVKSLADHQPTSLAQPARLLVMNAKVGQMTPPTLAGSSVELYAVCGKRSVTGDTKVREETQRKLMGAEMGIRAERLLRDLRQDAFIEYR